MKPVLRIFNDIWVTATHAIRVALVTNAPTALVDSKLPSYQRAATQPLSMDTSGNLRVATTAQPESPWPAQSAPWNQVLEKQDWAKFSPWE